MVTKWDEEDRQIALDSLSQAWKATYIASEHMKTFIFFFVPSTDEEAVMVTTMRGMLNLLSQLMENLYYELKQRYSKKEGEHEGKG
jgi:hypothetical protein